MKKVFKKGDLIEFEIGAYSDHQVMHPILVLKKFNLADESKEYIKQHPDQIEYYSFSFDQFFSWMQQKGLIEDCKPNFVYRVWIGAYSELNEELLK